MTALDKSVEFASKAMELIDVALIAGRNAGASGALPPNFHNNIYKQFVDLAKALIEAPDTREAVDYGWVTLGHELRRHPDGSTTIEMIDSRIER